jgi:hypothetical protein
MYGVGRWVELGGTATVVIDAYGVRMSVQGLPEPCSGHISHIWGGSEATLDSDLGCGLVHGYSCYNLYC